MSEQRLYGNWLRPQRLSIRGVGLKGALFALVGYFAGLVVLQSHPRAGLGILATCLVTTAASAARIGGATLREYVAGAARWQWARARRTTTFTAIHPTGWRLPGPLAHTRMVDVHCEGRAYGAVHAPKARRIAVTLELASTAADLTDAHEHDIDVARWERWLEHLGRRPEIAWVTATVETSPAPGTRLREALHQRLAPNAPPDCRALMQELAATSPAVAASTHTRLTLTFDLRAWDTQLPRRDRRDGLTAYLPLLDRAVTSLETGLHGCGVSVTRRATSHALAAVTRTAYDPAASGAVELATSPHGTQSGHRPYGDRPDLAIYRRVVADRELHGWELAGPASAVEHRDRYAHDSGTSAAFVWAQAPRQLVTSSVLDPLTRPGQFRKRVTVTYVPTPAGEAMDAATTQVRWRWLAQTISRLPIIGRPTSAQDERDADAAQQATYEVAAGAGWISQTITVTVTVLDEADLGAAVAEIEHAAGASQLRLRRLYELQAAGFAAGLPAGLSLTELAARWTR